MVDEAIPWSNHYIRYPATLTGSTVKIHVLRISSVITLLLPRNYCHHPLHYMHMHTHAHAHANTSHAYAQTQCVLQKKYSVFLCMCFVCR